MPGRFPAAAAPGSGGGTTGARQRSCARATRDAGPAGPARRADLAPFGVRTTSGGGAARAAPALTAPGSAAPAPGPRPPAPPSLRRPVDPGANSRPARAEHPLDQLNPQEVTRASAACKKYAAAQGIKQLRFNTVMLQEPAKAVLLRYEAGAGPAPPRQALCVAISIPDGQVVEAVVGLHGSAASKDAVQSWKLVRGGGGGRWRPGARLAAPGAAGSLPAAVPQQRCVRCAGRPGLPPHRRGWQLAAARARRRLARIAHPGPASHPGGRAGRAGRCLR
jgi:hypothetical protein